MKRSHSQSGIAAGPVAGIVLSAGLLLSACAGGPADDSVEPGVLDVQATEAVVSGSFERADGALTFSSEELAPGEFDIVVEVNGMTLAALVQRDAQVAEVDGFAADGSDTQMLDADRALLDGFIRALAAQTDVEGHAPAAILYRVGSNWAQTPDTMPLQRQVAGSEDRDFTSICANFNQFLLASHDGNQCGFFEPNCTSNAHVGNRSGSTFSEINGTFTTATPDHIAFVRQFGECYGNCGAGCPGGNQTLTLDCHDHDQCVRNGHFIASFFCNDEFASASDDEFFAPRCSGT